MPALEAFGRRWHVGSDDFVLPGICDLIIRISWFIAAAIVYWQSRDVLDSGCSGGEYIKYFLYASFATLQLIIFSDIALVHNSKAGSVMETEHRRFVPLCIYLRTLLVVLELSLNSVGTYWCINGVLKCSQAQNFESLVQGLIICNWLLAAFTLVLFLIMYDSLGTYHFDLSQDIMADPKLTKCWSFRWRFVCLYWWTKNEDIRTAFFELGSYMAAAFESADIVFSDLICGVILLFLKNDEMKKKLHSVSISSSIPEEMGDCDNQSTSSNNNSSGVEWLKMEEWNGLDKIHHFYQYAVACYTWGAVACTSSNPVWALWKDTFCCGCIRKNPAEFEIEGDSCCFHNSGSAQDIIRIGVENAEIVYCSFRDKVFQTPFIVALDHGEKAIVVAIRGTMSRADVVTDIYVRPISLASYGYPENFRVHKGMLMNALTVHDKMEEMQLMQRLVASHPDYKIVTTGTSLGSASATLLGLILKSEFPHFDIKCFAYSPSGALMNFETAKYCESFVTAITYGDDFVARFAVKSIERLKYDVVSILKECRTPKYRILVGGLLGLCGCRPKVSFGPASITESNRRESRQELISTYGFDFADINVVPMEMEKCPIYLSSPPGAHDIRSKSKYKKVDGAALPCVQSQPGKASSKLLPFELMYPPGKLLHITETSAFRSGRAKGDIASRWNIRWADRQEQQFRQIVFSRRMIMDHVPFRPNKALKDLARRWQHKHMNEGNPAQTNLTTKTDQVVSIINSKSSSISVQVPVSR